MRSSITNARSWVRRRLARTKCSTVLKRTPNGPNSKRRKINIDRRRILAPFDGQILEVFRHQNEWVQPGEPIIRLARLDKLQVDGWVYYKDNEPSEVDGCEVTIEVGVGHGRTTRATGRIVYVSPIAEGLEEGKLRYRVRAEIANRREQDHWVISPGLNAEMSIHLGTGGVSAAKR